MSRSRNNGRRSRDLWGKRPCAGATHSTFAKRLCRRIERRVARREEFVAALKEPAR